MSSPLLWIAIIIGESALGVFLLAERLGRPAPPVPDLAYVDRVTAEELRALAAGCRTPQEWARLGEVYLASGFFPEGEACLRQAAMLDPADSDFAFKHGFALERIGRLEDANACYEDAVRLRHPQIPDCWYYIGKNHLRREQAGPAAAAFARAGTLPAARYELALLKARSGETEDAEAEARRLCDEFPAAYPPVSLRYRLALARNDRPAMDVLADEFARRPAPLPTPLDAEIDWIFGVANEIGWNRLFRDAGRQIQDGRSAAAEPDLRTALAADWRPELADALAEVVFVAGRPAEAAEILADAVDRAGPSFELLWRLGHAREALGRPEQALPLWERAARLVTGPAGQDLWHDLAAYYQRAGNQKQARAFTARAHLAAGIQSLDAGRPDFAVRTLTQALEHDQTLVQAWYFLGEAARALDWYPAARSAYDRCLDLEPNHGRARRALQILPPQ